MDLIHTKEQADNGYKKYLKSRPGASKESVKRARDYKDMKIGCHPVLKTAAIDFEEEKSDILDQLKSFKPKSTIFEIGNTSKNKEKIDVMSEKRKKHREVIERNTVKLEKKNLKIIEEADTKDKENVVNSESVTEEDIENTFDNVVKEGKNRRDFKSKAKARERKAKDFTPFKDENNYIPYQPSDHHSEAGYSLKTGFSAQAHGAVLDFTGDDDQEIQKRKGAVVWDKKSKKYVKVQDDKKRIKTESGVYISATYKTNR